MLEAGEVMVGILDNNLRLKVVEKRAIASKSKQTCKHDSGKRMNKSELIHWPWLRSERGSVSNPAKLLVQVRCVPYVY